MTNPEEILQNRRHRKLVWLVGILIFILECAAGYYYNVYVGYYHTDGISRVANAFYVLYSRDPHLGAIGFVWNPLPSMVDLLFLLLYPWIPAMATKGIAGLLMCAIFASLTAAFVTKAFLRRGLPGWVAVVFPLLFSLNPMIFIFGFNGMSDAPFMFFLIVSIVTFLNWLDGKRLGDLALSSFALALSFWCRYEAVPLGGGLILAGLIGVMLVQRTHHPPHESRLKYLWSKAEGVLSILATPLFYSIFLWLLLNAIIMGNPFNFLNGNYTNLAQIEGHLEDGSIYGSLVGNPLLALLYAFKKVAVFSVPFMSILILKVLNHRLFQWDTLILILLFISIPMLQVVMLLKGSTLAWLRYFIYVLPVTLAWLPYELSKIKRQWHIAIPFLALVLNFGILSYAVTQPSIAPDENTFLQNSFGRHSAVYEEWRNKEEIARYLDKYYSQNVILTDSFSAYYIILQSKYPKRFFITSDYDFAKAISHPTDYGVEYFLIPKPGSPSILSAINDAYPNLYEHGAEWAELVKDFGLDWRLYKITNSTRGGF
ncbi:ArnT family glycosyltransferase [Desulforamulus ruminis]|uniref:Uncharacterized protein n=1 Tax=Desulforamulus ruminis (strain ATCC 23193 / DSM 2154 / NCIMB 8452 / DL) TaxID=696281 RepID=F6DPR5_DESRL|nr:glycosyltransferase family 39 protein [Desulforamulus ruminis]AEG60754.1 hypothetical protein Desru_2526 [Desulforamulus ruminis DSM 2154]